MPGKKRHDPHNEHGLAQPHLPTLRRPERLHTRPVRQTGRALLVPRGELQCRVVGQSTGAAQEQGVHLRHLCGQVSRLISTRRTVPRLGGATKKAQSKDWAFCLNQMVPEKGIEPSTFSLRMTNSKNSGMLISVDLSFKSTT